MFALSWLFTKIILICRVSTTSKFVHCAILLSYISTTFSATFDWISFTLRIAWKIVLISILFGIKNGVGVHPASASAGTRDSFSERKVAGLRI